jgi:hypothetical protein
VDTRTTRFFAQSQLGFHVYSANIEIIFSKRLHSLSKETLLQPNDNDDDNSEDDSDSMSDSDENVSSWEDLSWS